MFTLCLHTQARELEAPLYQCSGNRTLFSSPATSSKYMAILVEMQGLPYFYNIIDFLLSVAYTILR